MKNALSDVKKNNLFGKVLKKFLSDPTYAKHITKCKHKGYGNNRRYICTTELEK